MLLGSIAAGATTTFNTTFIPQFITIRGAAGAVLTGDVIGQINVQGDGVIFNLDAAGVDAMANIRQFGIQASVDSAGKAFQLSNGLVNGKNCYWTFTNNDAAAIDIYGYSKEKKGNFYVTYMTQLCLANSGVDFTKFGFLAIPAATAAESITVMYNDGTVSVISINELRSDLLYSQTQLVTAIDNIDPARVKMVTYIPAANRNAYLTRYQPVSGNVDSAALARA